MNDSSEEPSVAREDLDAPAATEREHSEPARVDQAAPENPKPAPVQAVPNADCEADLGVNEGDDYSDYQDRVGAREEGGTDNLKTPDEPAREIVKDSVLTISADFEVNFVFPNAKEGELYRVDDVKSKLFGFHAPNISHYYLEGLEESGIALDEDDDVVTGIPQLEKSEPKTLEVTIYFHRNDKTRGRPLAGSARLLINPDPTKLWKNQASDPKLPYHKDDEDSCLITDSTGQLVGASKRGRSHAHEGSCRDDDFVIKFFHQTGWWLSIVADGAGSAKFSRKGSKIASRIGAERFEEAIELLESEEMATAIAAYSNSQEGAEAIIRRNLANLLIRKVGYEAFLAIYEHAEAEGDRAKDYNTTFLTTAWKHIGEGKWFVCAFAIGDGGIAVVQKDGEVSALNTGDEGEYSGETVFLTTNSVWKDQEGLRERVRFGVFDQVLGIFSMSDGVTDPMFETEHNFANSERWCNFLRELEKEVYQKNTDQRLDRRFLAWLDFWSPGNHDDRTIAVFYPAS